MKKQINTAFIGLGDRGRTALRMLSAIPQVHVAAVCDKTEANINAALPYLPPSAVRVADDDAYLRVCNMRDVDLLYICTDWNSHARIALSALQSGKHVALEVPAAFTLDDIRLLVSTASSTGLCCFMLENCCFESQVLDAIAAIRRGDIGELVHAEGSYYHNLDDRWSPWRLEVNRQFRGDPYPTHELGPICMAMDIGRTDRLTTLVSMDSMPFKGPQVYERTLRKAAPDFACGDHTTTLIRTQRGRTILLKHDVVTSMPYERQLSFIGTHGRIVLNDTGKASHEEMTRAMNDHLIQVLLNNVSPAISLQDMATWCAAIPLSAQSIAQGFAPVAYPDFYDK